MRAAYAERDHRHRTADELFPPTFPAFPVHAVPTPDREPALR